MTFGELLIPPGPLLVRNLDKNYLVGHEAFREGLFLWVSSSEHEQVSNTQSVRTTSLASRSRLFGL